MWRAISLLGCYCASLPLWAECRQLLDLSELKAKNPIVSSIEFKQENVFDLTEPGVFWVHRFANRTHIVTTEDTIRDDLLFLQDAPLNLAELAETERLLRSRRYLRDARVEVSQYCADTNTVTVSVTTWDNWSLLPKVEFSSEGGASRYSFGIAEDNLLGSGNQLLLDYTKDSERSGYLLSFASPNIFGSHWNTLLSYADKSDGENYQFILQRPFYRLDSAWAVNLDLLKNKQQVTDYVLDQPVNEYDRTRNQFDGAVGFKLQIRGQTIQRLYLGLTLEDVSFEPLPETLRPLPQDRNLSYVYLEYQLLQDNFHKLFNINQFNRVEDINAGWQLRLRLGYLQPWLGADESGVRFDAALNKAWQLNARTWLFAELDYHRLNWQQLNQQLTRLSMQLNHQLNRYNSLVTSITAERGRDLFADEQLYLGGASGLRAFPLFYQKGDNRMVATAEYRHYTDWNLWQFFDVGFATFADIGRSWGGTTAAEARQQLGNQAGLDDKILLGFGVGLRLLSSHSSRGTMIHLDLTRPVSDNPDIGNWQWRATAKRRF